MSNRAVKDQRGFYRRQAEWKMNWAPLEYAPYWVAQKGPVDGEGEADDL